MNKKMIKFLSYFILNSKRRKEFRSRYLRRFDNEGAFQEIDAKKIKLIMCLLCKNEEAIVEQNIRFHYAMGVDGVIAMNHNSTDNTLEILEKLKKEGIVLEIINKTCPDHKRHEFYDEMIQLARDKYGADWVINVDADEFYFSKSLNLKKSIAECPFANIIKLDSTFFFPDDRDDFLSCPYFVTHPFYEFEKELFKLDEKDESVATYIGSIGCTKVLCDTRSYQMIFDGNHDVATSIRRVNFTSDIVLYHYHIKNYKFYEAKVVKWEEALKHTPAGGMSHHLKRMLALYKDGKLREDYDKLYGSKMLEFLDEHGVVTKDYSVYNFLKYSGIVK